MMYKCLIHNCLLKHSCVITHSFPGVPAQQSLSDKGFKKGQTLTYLNGYQRGSAMPMVNEVPVSTAELLGMGLGSTAKEVPAYTSTLSTVASPGSLPQWVSNDRKVCYVSKCSIHAVSLAALHVVTLVIRIRDLQGCVDASVFVLRGCANTHAVKQRPKKVL